MSERLEIRRISTPERLFRKILEEMAQPVGVMILGADHRIKNQVYGKCVRLISGLAVQDSCGTVEMNQMKQLFSEGKSALMIMSGDLSAHRYCREQEVKKLREAGAETVIGIYVKVVLTTECTGLTTTIIGQVARILNDPPMAEEFDYLIDWTEKEE